MEKPIEKYYYFKYYVYLRVGRPTSGITHSEDNNMPYVKERIEKEAGKKHGENLHYVDIWTMHPWFTEIIEYKKEKGLD